MNVTKLGSKAGNFSSGLRERERGEIEGQRDREAEGQRERHWIYQLDEINVTVMNLPFCVSYSEISLRLSQLSEVSS